MVCCLYCGKSLRLTYCHCPHPSDSAPGIRVAVNKIGLSNNRRDRTRRCSWYSFPRSVNLVSSGEDKPMNDADTDHRQQVALFRYGLIADLVRLEPGSKGLYAKIANKAAGEYTIPGTTRTRVAAETIRDWLKRYRRGGFDALLPKPRSDRGQSRSLPAAVVDALLGTKEGNPALSVQSGHPRSAQKPRSPSRSSPARVHRPSPARPSRLDGQIRGPKR